MVQGRNKHLDQWFLPLQHCHLGSHLGYCHLQSCNQAKLFANTYLKKPSDIFCLYFKIRPSSLYHFGGTYTKIGTIQRRLAWPLRKDDTQNREAFHIFLSALYQWKSFILSKFSFASKIKSKNSFFLFKNWQFWLKRLGSSSSCVAALKIFFP